MLEILEHCRLWIVVFRSVGLLQGLPIPTEYFNSSFVVVAQTDTNLFPKFI